MADYLQINVRILRPFLSLKLSVYCDLWLTKDQYYRIWGKVKFGAVREDQQTNIEVAAMNV